MSVGRFGLLMTNYSHGLAPDRLFGRVGEIARAVDESVFDTLWLPDHLMQGPVGDIEANQGAASRTPDGPRGRRTPMFDAPTLLGALAVATTRVRLGPLVSPVTTRHPALLAKAMATVDVVSGGRAVVGLGAAWDADEHQRFGIPFPPARERVDGLEDAARICRAMFDEPTASHQGRRFSVDRAINEPRPVSPRVPLLVGGTGARVLRIAATYADACNPIGEADAVRRAFAAVDRCCAEIGRDPAEVARLAGVMFHRTADVPALVAEAFAVGADGVILVPWQIALSPEWVSAISGQLASEFGDA
ncbi:LLM class flavin-dependent oxidoreductase [Frankia sp. CNm7]|uniref:LLM class flavin-dependent oxidoreductase n=1 Tax=Frankia nepalensis TaxID=1836974 RepID=A0A937RS16_9ACTN|nr:LLM class flavin-dependent oxidoreductase [Frankia nepalensis]MBL7500226.1 LLM class flavin-dependent oxidoreductase [Frankia nepalensis]MBL7514280.1 LLM class flavin-dependent oxidoreductase [Frankia nepalensis]MBL7523755.1 LLM class flavin-dependent oxidoreductase [Frankia nepalensis]MBL7631688.1 LLM class flavin-dependent oxidoreductase [Frankia nepalensis]